MNTETRIIRLEGRTTTGRRHIIVVRFEDSADPGPMNTLSCRDEVFRRKAGESYESFLNRAAGDAVGVTVVYTIDAPKPKKHLLLDSIYMGGNA